MATLPVRSFDGVDDRIRCLRGSTDIMGAWSAAALIRPAAEGWYMISQGHDAAGSALGYSLQIRSRQVGTYSSGGGSGEPFSTSALIASGAWTIVAVTKESGLVYPQFHVYPFSAGVWRDERATVQTSNVPSFGSGGLMHFGSYGGSYRYRGELAAVAMWDIALPTATVAQLSAVSALAGWAGVGGPRALWLLDQTDPETDVLDLVGGAHEHDHTGTTVVYADLPIPYRLSSAAVRDGSGWSDRPLLVHGGADWINPTSVGVL